MDTIAKYRLGPEKLEKIQAENKEKIERLQSKYLKQPHNRRRKVANESNSPSSHIRVKFIRLSLRNDYDSGTTCNETHPAFWQLPKNKRKQRNFGGIPGFGDDPNGINPGDMWNVFETGTILLESDEGKKTTVKVDKFS